MKKSIWIITFLILILSTYSCNNEHKAFTKANQANTLEAILEFANNYPESQFIDSAKVLIDKLVWDSILQKDVICDYQTFIDEHPDSKFIDSAKAMIDKQQPIKEFENEVKDKDCNIYKTVKIGTQNWMAENLRTTKFKDGESIAIVSDKDSWGKLNSPALCWYNNNSVEHKYPHGALYNWFAVKTEKLCPKGWHVPTESEWDELIKYLGGSQNAEIKMKSEGDAFWKLNNEKSTNSSDLNGLASGSRNIQGIFSNIGEASYWWLASDAAFAFSLSSKSTNTDKVGQNKNSGFSVRCVEDIE